MMIDILFKNTAGNVFLFLCGLEWWKTVDFVHINIRKHWSGNTDIYFERWWKFYRVDKWEIKEDILN